MLHEHETYDSAIEMFKPRLRSLLDYCRVIKEEKPENFRLTRPQLNFVKAKSEQAEELLDAFGARNNEEWFPIRENVAMLKNFSNSTYELLHIYHSSEFYELGEKKAEFISVTELHITMIAEFIRCALINFLAQAEELGLTMKPRPFKVDFTEILIPCRLPRNRRPEDPANVKNRIDALAINVLNTTEDVKNFRRLAAAKLEAWDSLDFDFLSETKFRSLEVNMHVLQSLYDTYISDSDTEDMDKDLLVLRGRITVVLHLLRIATIYIHYHERHVNAGNGVICIANCHGNVKSNCSFFSNDVFKGTIIRYLSKYIAHFLMEGRGICSSLLRKYCVNKTVEVKVPPYVGFHVRPSTLVAAIVLHYGCEVKMHLGNVAYDASSYPNIIMANNYLDQKKRAHLLEQLQHLDLSEYEKNIKAGLTTRFDAMRQIILRLASMNVVRIYKSIPCEVLPKDTSETLLDYVYNSVVFMMNNDRQVGILYDAMVVFSGPEQAVDDIATLANAKYCESETGEDLPLPKQLDYLNFKRKALR